MFLGNDRINPTEVVVVMYLLKLEFKILIF